MIFSLSKYSCLTDCSKPIWFWIYNERNSFWRVLSSMTLNHTRTESVGLFGVLRKVDNGEVFLRVFICRENLDMYIQWSPIYVTLYWKSSLFSPRIRLFFAQSATLTRIHLIRPQFQSANLLKWPNTEHSGHIGQEILNQPYKIWKIEYRYR